MKTEHAILCGTKASRESLLAQIVALAEKCGATAHMRDSYRERSLEVTLTKMPWSCNITFDGASHVGAFLGHWYHDGTGNETLPDSFGSAIQGSVNQFHRRKATTCESHFPLFLLSIERGLQALAS